MAQRIKLNWLLSTIVVLLLATSAKAIEVELTLVSGSVLKVDAELATIGWTEVRSDGQMLVQTIPLEQIQRLSLCSTPASEQIAEIRQLLVQLQSDDYHEREYAEAQLSSPEIGNRFPKLLRSFADRADAESRYRAERILEAIQNAEATATTEFDELTLASGRRLTGDAGSFEISAVIDGQTLLIDRSRLRMIRSSDEANAKGPVSVPEGIEIVHVSDEIFYRPDQITIQLERDPAGNELARKSDITDTYVPDGLRMRSAEPGYVVISGYGFKFPDTPTGKNSGSVYLEEREGKRVRYKRFRGTLLIDFCVPNQPYQSAGVNEFGLHIANVNHERDFILEAFNAQGQIIAMVEAGSRDCPFLGVRSAEPIVSLRLRSNPFLGRLERMIDEDFAFDSICFSVPVPVDSVPAPTKSRPAKSKIETVDGNVWVGHRIEQRNDGTVVLVTDEFRRQPVFDRAQIAKMTFANRNDAERPQRSSWSVQLTDGSIWHVDPSDDFESQLVRGFRASRDQIVALWPTGVDARQPASKDFANADRVVVFPTCRKMADRVRFGEDGYSWMTTDTKLQALAPNASKSAQREDPSPDVSEVAYKNRDVASPTLWLQRPKPARRTAGCVMLNDGQRLMFGDGCLMRLVKSDADLVQLAIGQKTLTIKNERIRSIKFETSTPQR